MKPDRTVKRRILRDCAAAMWPSVAVYALGDLAAYCLSVFSAGELDVHPSNEGQAEIAERFLAAAERYGAMHGIM